MVLKSSVKTNPIPQQVEELLNRLTKELPVETLEWIKKRFETYIPHLLGEGLGKIEIGLVVDTSTIVRALLHYAKGRTSILFKLSENPFFALHVPKEVEEEVMRQLDKKAKKGVDRKKMLEGWEKIKHILKIDDVKSEQAKKTAKQMIGKRDPTDIPFVAMYIEMKAAAVLTDDSDYEHPSIRKWNIEKLGDVVGTYYRGIYSFVVVHDFVPIAVDILSKIVLAIVNRLFQGLSLILEIGENIVAGAVENIMRLISKIPRWLAIVLIGVVASVAVWLAVDAKSRKKVSGTINYIWAKAKPLIENIVVWITDAIEVLVSYVKAMGPYAGVTLTVLVELYESIIEVAEAIKSLQVQESL